MLGPEAAILRPKTAVSFILALFSAVAHSSWNLLLKRAGDSEVFAFGRGLHFADPGGTGAALIQLGGPLRSWVPSAHHSSPRPLLQPVGPRLCSRRPFPGLSGGPGHGAHAGAGVGRDLLERDHRIPRHRRDSRHHRRDIHNLMVGQFNQALRSLLLFLRSA